MHSFNGQFLEERVQRQRNASERPGKSARGKSCYKEVGKRTNALAMQPVRGETLLGGGGGNPRGNGDLSKRPEGDRGQGRGGRQAGTAEGRGKAGRGRVHTRKAGGRV